MTGTIYECFHDNVSFCFTADSKGDVIRVDGGRKCLCQNLMRDVELLNMFSNSR